MTSYNYYYDNKSSQNIWTQQQEAQDAACFCCDESTIMQEGQQERPRDPLLDDFDVMGNNDQWMQTAQDINDLTHQEREFVFDQVHGVAKLQEETSELLDTCLATFQKELQAFRASKRQGPQKRARALDKAIFYRPSLLTDRDFHLLFLRADYYDATKAVRRMAQYFDDKLTLFGEDKLVKKITLEDLDDTDRRILDSGFFMILPHKDQTGRPIWFCDITKFDFNNGDNLLRCCWYQVMGTLDDPGAQMKGVCNVSYCPGHVHKSIPLSQFASVMLTGGDMLMNLPFRLTGYHFCYNDPKLQYILTMACKAFGKQVRIRIRTHYGSDLEMQYSLLTFGIRCKSLLGEGGGESDDSFSDFDDDDIFPDTAKNNNNNNTQAANTMHQRYIERRLKIEAQHAKQKGAEQAKSGIVLYPNPNDVLIGRGRPYREFSGNLRWSRLIDALLEKHRQCADRFGKTCISMDVVKTVYDRGGRFLTPASDNRGWEIMDDLTAREKTASGFRSRYGAKQQQQLQQQKQQQQQQQQQQLVPTLAAESSLASSSSSLGYGGAKKRLRYDPNYQ